MTAPHTPTRYPTGGDYVDALQHPGTAFTDPQLRTGEVTIDDGLGLPTPVSGNFASVFQVTATDGSRWAVKCFTRPIVDQQRRYHAIAQALQHLNHQALVDFDYQPAGVMIRGRRYPLVKMRWVDAQGLLPWLEANHTNPTGLTALSEQLLDIVGTLERAGITHGDLQHGNLLVTADTRLVLIDYDGMYVPDLHGLPPTEKGLPNYQHPGRGDHEFGPGLDRFSAWVIYTSLTALALQPTLWRQLRDSADDTKILLAAADYANPTTSPALQTLRATDHPQLAALADAITIFAHGPLARVPAPDRYSTVVTVQAPPTTSPGDAGMPDWLTDHLTTTTGPAAFAAMAAATPTEPVPFGRTWHLRVARIVTVSGLLSTGGAAAAAMGIAPVSAVTPFPWLAAALLALLILGWVYRRHPQVTARHQAFAALGAADNQVRLATQRRNEVEQLIADLDPHQRRQQREVADQRDAATRRRQDAETAANQVLQATLAQIDRERRDPSNSLRAWEAAEVDRIRAAHLHQALRNASIVANPPFGIDRKVAGNLAQAGFRTAADFVGMKVVSGGRYPKALLCRTPSDHGIHVDLVGEKRAKALLAWRQAIMTAAQRSAPPYLTPSQRHELTRRHEQHERVLNTRVEAARATARAAVTNAKNQEQQQQTHLDSQQLRIDTEINATRANLHRRLTGTTNDLDRANQLRHRAQATVNTYTRITFTQFVGGAARPAAPHRP